MLVLIGRFAVYGKPAGYDAEHDQVRSKSAIIFYSVTLNGTSNHSNGNVKYMLQTANICR